MSGKKKRQKPKHSVLKFLSEKKPQQAPESGQRLADFKKFFGDDLLKLDKEFIAYVNRLN